MDLIERERYISLYEVYQKLLTEKQQKYFTEYYLYDFSLSEIAANEHVSRNAIFDQVKKTTILLDFYEEKLELYSKKEKLLSLMDEMPEALKKKINEII